VRFVVFSRAVAWASIASILALAGAAAHHASAAVLVVGDSLGVGTEPALRAALPSVSIDTDVRNGRYSAEGVPILAARLGPEHDVVVFDLGTNDGPRGVAATARSLAAVRSIVGDRCLVVATLNHPRVGGVSIEGQNEMIDNFVAATPNATLVDWHGAARASGALRPDGVHATAPGYALRGALFADAIVGCRRSAGPASRPRGRGASTTARPADTRARRAARQPLEERLSNAVAQLALTRVSIALAGRVGTLVRDAGASLAAVLTPRGPEPVLGAAGESE
jgi:lysophospholipase L1-like esterase